MIDLHTHTTCSDGSFTPEKLVEKALEINLSALAVTDHDGTEGIDRAMAAAGNSQLTIIPGIEIEVDFYPGEFHLLGLGLTDWRGKIKTRMADIRERRHVRNRSIIERMREANWNITYEEVEKKATSDLVARPHFASVLVDKGLAKNTRQAFDKYLAMGRPFYIRKEALELDEAVSLIRDAGGIPILAHPLSLYLSWGKLPSKLDELKEAGIAGLEAWHPSINLRKAERLVKLADERGLLLTGGSDFHGELRKDRSLGLSSGGKMIPDEYLAPFL